MCGQTLHAGSVEQLAGVVERQRQAPLVVFLAVQLQVELGLAAVPWQLFGEQPGQAAQSTQIALLVVEHDLEQALLAGIREGCQQLFEGQVLMFLSLQGCLADLSQQVGERQARGEPGTQDLGVDEKTDQPLGFQAWTVGIRHPDTDIGLPAVAVQQALETGQEDHEQGAVVLAGGAAQRFGQRRRHPQAQACGRLVLLAGTRVVGGQVKHRLFVAQLRLPVAQLPRGLPFGQPLPLPAAIVGIVQGQCRQLGLLPLAVSGVQTREFVDEDVHRPAIGNDVVHGDPQLMRFAVQARQGHPQQWTGLQIERLLRFGFTSRQYCFAVEVAQVQLLHSELQRWQDTLQRLAINLGKHRTQRFMTLDQGLEAGLQRRLVQLAAQTQRPRNVIGGALRLQLPEQPQTILPQ
ncbi:hypothetical protein D3C77_176020 [compost metagenome]